MTKQIPRFIIKKWTLKVLKGGYMNKNVLETQWPQIREILRDRFSNLTEADIREINGRYDQLVAKLQQKYGYSHEEAEERIQSWNFDRATYPRGQIRDEKFRKEKSFSPFAWLLAIGIPLLLLATYFLNTPRTPEAMRSPAANQEQIVTQTPGDLVLSNGLRNAFLSNPALSTEVQNLQITTNNGVVTLSGSVPDRETRDFILTTAKNYNGVIRVIDHLQIR